VPQRLAIISSKTAAGYEDFLQRLENNPYGYRFVTKLFPAIMQGAEAENSIVQALTQIQSEHTNNTAGFDCVVLIRGGGGIVDLSCFDTYLLCRSLAEFPLPVHTGIGHERDQSVADLVAFNASATPTAAAEYLIKQVRTFEEALLTLAGRISQRARTVLGENTVQVDRLVVRCIFGTQKRLDEADRSLAALVERTASGVRAITQRHFNLLTQLATRLELAPPAHFREQDRLLTSLVQKMDTGTSRAFERAAQEVTGLEREVKSRDPKDVLRRGYSITRSGGKVVTSTDSLIEGSTLETTLFTGKVSSTVTAWESNERAENT
jgi:exodeoxyribonuclease VII large subunit